MNLTGLVDLADPPRARRQARQYIQSQQDAAPMPRPLPVIYLENAETPHLLVENPDVSVMKQKNLQFVPPILPVQVGSPVRFPNLDSTYHNVFSYSPAKTFDLGRYRKDEEPPTRYFAQPGVVQLFCEVHDHMRATILILETPFFTIADEEGRFSITGIPAGQYNLVIWHSTRNQEIHEVVIPEHKDFHLDLTEKAP